MDGSDALDSVIKSMVERRAGKGEPAISTGLASLDHALIGLRGKKMYVIAGRPSMGKSAISTTIRRSVVAQGYGVAEFNLEMGSDEIGERELAFRADMNVRRIMSPENATDLEVERAISQVGSIPRGLWYVHDNLFGINDIVTRSREIHSELAEQGIKLGVVLIDYLQLLADTGSEGRQQSVSACSRACKLLSKELDVAVVALSQLNRNCEFREDKRPMMSDIRESGSIEQDADVIAFVYREHIYNQAVPPEQAEFIIRKQRSGPIGTVHLRFNPRQVYFSDPPADGVPLESEQLHQ